ncbi:MAG: metal ABC transporter solute-binding protein, Zn/Mn family [Ktedonobacteraceae bacterium]
MARRATVWLTVSVILLFLFSACDSTVTGSGNTSSASSVINVVAAENFYGDIVKQLGGSRVSVTSILSDPSVDPHQYESSVQTGIAVSKAQLVIENAGGYDSWMDRLIAASPNSNRIVLKGYNTAPTLLSENEHVWYSVDNVAAIAQAITNDLKKLDSADATTFDHNLNAFQQSLTPIRQKMSEIKAKYNGTPVGLTETIYLYQTGPLGLNVLTPFVFQKAMAEGNDPPVASVITAENQINQHQIKVLIYNEQTVTPSTTKLEHDAQQQHIPIVPVTETMPSTKTYQTWMLDQLNTLEQALGK